eukprot:scaffold38919_cov26-Phaeocystis_antarctica.AAC.2
MAALRPPWPPGPNLRRPYGPPDFGGVAARFSVDGRPNLVRGPPHLAAGRPWWRQGGPLTR